MSDAAEAIVTRAAERWCIGTLPDKPEICTIYGMPAEDGKRQRWVYVQIDAPQFRQITPKERLAYAHLIAAAPELLEALKAVLPIAEAYVKHFSVGLGAEGRELLEAHIAEARVAIAKAEGLS